MSKKIIWNDDNTITVDVPARPKKVTGTRLASIMGLNQWSTPFKAWCAITKTYEEPFEDTIYTIAGKTIEPKQADYIEKIYFWDKLIRPTDIYGPDPFKVTWGDFFREKKVVGGMWDYLLADKSGKPHTVLEMKTTKRAEDWLEDIPEYYAVQAALYAHLLGVDNVIMVCTILEDSDYAHPEDFKVSRDNTFERRFKVSERYPDFDKTIRKVYDWWAYHVEGGISPVYDEKKDADILKALRSESVTPDTDLRAMLAEAEEIQSYLNAKSAELEEYEKRLKVLKDAIKEEMMKGMNDDTDKVIAVGNGLVWTLGKSVSLKVDEKQMQKDGILGKYKTKETVTYRLTTKEKEI